MKVAEPLFPTLIIKPWEARNAPMFILSWSTSLALLVLTLGITHLVISILHCRDIQPIDKPEGSDEKASDEAKKKFGKNKGQERPPLSKRRSSKYHTFTRKQSMVLRPKDPIDKQAFSNRGVAMIYDGLILYDASSVDERPVSTYTSTYVYQEPAPLNEKRIWTPYRLYRTSNVERVKEEVFKLDAFQDTGFSLGAISEDLKRVCERGLSSYQHIKMKGKLLFLLSLLQKDSPLPQIQKDLLIDGLVQSFKSPQSIQYSFITSRFERFQCTSLDDSLKVWWQHYKMEKLHAFVEKRHPKDTVHYRNLYIVGLKEAFGFSDLEVAKLDSQLPSDDGFDWGKIESALKKEINFEAFIKQVLADINDPDPADYRIKKSLISHRYQEGQTYPDEPTKEQKEGSIPFISRDELIQCLKDAGLCQ